MRRVGPSKSEKHFLSSKFSLMASYTFTQPFLELRQTVIGLY